MRIVVLFPTVEEAKGFLLSEPHVPVFISGRGPVQTAAAVVRAVKARKPHLVVLAGTAAACDRMLPLGEAVEVTSRFEAELAAAERRIYRTDPATDLPAARRRRCSARAAIFGRKRRRRRTLRQRPVSRRPATTFPTTLRCPPPKPLRAIRSPRDHTPKRPRNTILRPAADFMPQTIFRQPAAAHAATHRQPAPEPSFAAPAGCRPPFVPHPHAERIRRS